MRLKISVFWCLLVLTVVTAFAQDDNIRKEQFQFIDLSVNPDSIELKNYFDFCFKNSQNLKFEDVQDDKEKFLNLDNKKYLLKYYRILGLMHYNSYQFDSTLYYLHKARVIGIENFLYKDVSEIYSQLGIYHGQVDNLDSAEYYCLKSINLIESNELDLELHYLYNGLGLVYRIQGKYYESLLYLNKAIKIAKEKEYIGDYIVYLSNLVGLQYELNDLEKAKETANHGLEAIKDTSDRNAIMFYYSLSNIYYLQDNIEKSIEYAQKTIDLAKKYNLKNDEFSAKLNLANCYNSLGDYHRTEVIVDEVLPYFLSIEDAGNYNDAYVLLAESAVHQGNYNKALKYIELVYQWAIENGSFTALENSTNILSKIYSEQHDYQKAYDFLKIYVSAKDSIYQSNLSDEMTRFSMNLKLEKLEAANELERREREAGKKRMVIVLVLGGVIITLAIILIIVLITRNQYRNRQNTALKEKNMKIHKQKMQIEYNKLEIETQHKKLLGYKDYLEELVESKTTELREAKESAEESDNLKTEFLSNIKHEVRTPLNVIINAANMIVSGEYAECDKKGFIDMIIRNSDRLIDTVENIELLSSLQTNNINIEISTCRVADINQALIEYIYSMQKDNPNVEIKTNFPNSMSNLTVPTNTYYISKAIGYIIDNSYKFTPEGEVEIGLTQGEDNHIRFYVKDTGIGISEEYLEKIFIPFYQVDGSMNRGYEGNGVGLSIFKKLLEVLGGTIGVESKLNQGSEFWCEIPLSKVYKGVISY